MTIELSATVEKELRDLAVAQSRDVGEVVEEAVWQYLEAAAITDLDAADVAETQVELVGELQDVKEGKDSRPEREADVEAAWRQEVADRVAALEAGEVEMIPWKEIRDGFLARLSERRAPDQSID